MDTRIQLLFESLSGNGWEKVGSINERLDWKYKDVIEFQSIWAPRNKSIFISLLTDPYPSKKSSSNIWAIEISDKSPLSLVPRHILVKSLIELSKEGIESIIKNADFIRNEM